jgi:hypothetical protein
VARELSFESEFFVYLNLAHPAGSVRSHILRALAENRSRLVFFLGLRLRFQKYDDPEDYVHIWISSRTTFPYDGRISLPDEQLRTNSGAAQSVKRTPSKGEAADGCFEA